MNRRSVLRWLGLAPVAAPAAVAAASAPALPPIDYSGLVDGVSRQIAAVNARMMASEQNIRALTDPVIADARDSVARLSAAESRLVAAEHNIRMVEAQAQARIEALRASLATR